MPTFKKILLLAALLGLPIGCAKSSDTEGLGGIRLFEVDDSRGWIRDRNPDTGLYNNLFPAPTATVSSSGCALAYNARNDILYFMDPSEPNTIYRIFPANSGPGLVDAEALPTSAFFPYDGLGYDGNQLLALDSSADFIDALDPATGDIIESTAFAVDLMGALDATRKMGIFAAGFDVGMGQNVLYILDSMGAAIDSIALGPGFDPQGVAIAKNFLFASNVSRSEIQIYKIERDKGSTRLKPIKTLPFPPGAQVSALGAGKK